MSLAKNHIFTISLLYRAWIDCHHKKMQVDAMNLGITALGQLCFAAPVYCAVDFGRRVRQTCT
jgi:hypothetical protein